MIRISMLFTVLTILTGLAKSAEKTDCTSQNLYDRQRSNVVGTRAFIPLNLTGELSYEPHREKVLCTIQGFEKSNPNLEILPGGWRVESRPQISADTYKYGVFGGSGTISQSGYILGIWVDFKKKPMPAK